jgi:U4/U6 small nuclear ribonucleoprotein PRP31
MSTDADDLLNDFGSSGDEAEEEKNDGLVNDQEANRDRDRDAMELDRDAEAKDDDDSDAELNDRDDSEATKVKVEKMQLGGVKDVRSVASLMQTLEPVLEVSTSIPLSFFTVAS